MVCTHRHMCVHVCACVYMCVPGCTCVCVGANARTYLRAHSKCSGYAAPLGQHQQALDRMTRQRWQSNWRLLYPA